MDDPGPLVGWETGFKLYILNLGMSWQHWERRFLQKGVWEGFSASESSSVKNRSSRWMQPWVLVRSKAFRTHQLCSRPESSSQGTRKLAWGACAWTSILAHSYPPWCTFSLQSSSFTRGLSTSVSAFRNTPPRCPWTFLMLCHQHTRGGVFIMQIWMKPQVKVEKMFLNICS